MRAKGFTLIEILVVLVIMAVMISLVTISIGTTGRDNQLDEETRRIEALLSLLHDRAVLEGRDFGMKIEPGAYEFMVFDNRRQLWLHFDDENQYRHRQLPPGLSFQLQLDSQQIVLKQVDSAFKKDEAPPPPQLAVAASGEGTPFRLTLLREGTQNKAEVSGDAFGKLTHKSSDQSAMKKG